jgi:hypothetical protein
MERPGYNICSYPWSNHSFYSLYGGEYQNKISTMFFSKIYFLFTYLFFPRQRVANHLVDKNKVTNMMVN